MCGGCLLSIPTCCEDEIIEYEVMKLEHNDDVDTMFNVFNQYICFGPIELYADLVKSTDQIISNLTYPRSVDRIVTNLTEPNSVTSLTQP